MNIGECASSEVSWLQQLLALIVVFYWERWVGRTKWFTAASTWDLVANGFKTVWAWIKNKLNKKPPQQEENKNG